VSAGNPAYSDINEVDVEAIDFYNQNPQFYQHQDEIVENQEYFARDSTGYIGAAKYPWSAKLDTLALGKVALDIFEQKRLQREHAKEMRAKYLHIVKEDDDVNEVIFKLFE
jgi:hypothetical protein